MAHLIRVIGFANGAPCAIAGMYVKRFDFDHEDGKGLGTFVWDATRAMKFATAADAMAFWKTQSTTKPKRADGKPNRPFTSTHVEVVPAPGNDALH